MIAIERLKDKIESWKADFENLKEENIRLKEELQSIRSGSGLADGDLAAELAEKDSVIQALRKELEQKDIEIEAIISKVEALLE